MNWFTTHYTVYTSHWILFSLSAFGNRQCNDVNIERLGDNVAVLAQLAYRLTRDLKSRIRLQECIFLVLRCCSGYEAAGISDNVFSQPNPTIGAHGFTIVVPTSRKGHGPCGGIAWITRRGASGAAATYRKRSTNFPRWRYNCDHCPLLLATILSFERQNGDFLNKSCATMSSIRQNEWMNHFNCICNADEIQSISILMLQQCLLRAGNYWIAISF